MMEAPVTTSLRFTQNHEWVRVDGDEATVGVTNYAQNELGDIVYVEVPDLGKTVKAGEEIAVLESTKAAADVYSPLTGEIVAVNEELEAAPELVNSSPEQDGWLFKIKVASAAELEKLLDVGQYKKLVG